MLFSTYVISPAEFEAYWPLAAVGLMIALFIIVIATNSGQKEKKKEK